MTKNSEGARWLASVIDLYGITNVPEFLGQVMHESGRLQRTVENLNYSVDALLSMFGRHRISEADARRYGRTSGQAANQEAIANIIYGGEWGRKNLGNTQPGDGWKFRGHGFIQLTGRAAHQAFADFMGMPELMDRPDRIATDMHLAAHAAAWFWCHYKKINGITDVREVTRLVTGSPTHALAERQALTLEAKRLLNSAEI